MSDIKKAALDYENERGGDCLNSRTQPGTPIGECIYIFCGCDLNKAFLEGATAQRQIDALIAESYFSSLPITDGMRKSHKGNTALEIANSIRAESLDGTNMATDSGRKNWLTDRNAYEMSVRFLAKSYPDSNTYRAQLQVLEENDELRAEIIENKRLYKLVSDSDDEQIEHLKSENARLRAALETITESDFPYNVAWEALQYYDDLKKAKENYD